MTVDYRGLGESDTGWAELGTADEDFPDAAAEGRFVAESLGGRLELLDGYGHQPHEEAPELIAELIVGFDPVGPGAARSAA